MRRDEAILERSRAGLGDESIDPRGWDWTDSSSTPGAHMGRGQEAGLDLIATSIDAVLGKRDPGPTRLLLEVTAGQGTVVGHRLEHLEQILERARSRDQLGICLDTCHLFAAGYVRATPDGIDRTLEEVSSRFGRESLGCIHLNDSRFPLGSRRDRHANIGEGEIGEEALGHLLAPSGGPEIPLVLETPLGDDKDGHRRDLELLRTFVS